MGPDARRHINSTRYGCCFWASRAGGFATMFTYFALVNYLTYGLFGGHVRRCLRSRAVTLLLTATPSDWASGRRRDFHQSCRGDVHFHVHRPTDW